MIFGNHAGNIRLPIGMICCKGVVLGRHLILQYRQLGLGLAQLV